MVWFLEKIRFDLYSSVMGITGLGLAWRFAAQYFQISGLIGTSLIWLGFSIYILLNILNILRAVIKPALIIQEWRHPDQFNFIPTVTIAGSLLACGVLPYSKILASIIWLPTVLFQIILIITALRRWLIEPVQITQITPVWLIPMVGNASPCFAGVALGYGSLSFALLMSALVCWILFTPLIIGRLILHKPERNIPLAPSVAIIVSAPAVIAIGFSNYPEISGIFIYILAYAALMFAIVLISLGKYFIIREFSRSLWAFTFPASALASSLFRVYFLHPDQYTMIQALIGLFAASLIVVLIGCYAMSYFLSCFKILRINKAISQYDQR